MIMMMDDVGVTVYNSDKSQASYVIMKWKMRVD